MPSELIQWFPGHMAKTKRLIRESLPLVDIVIEILDARIPYSSRNPDIEKLSESKPRLVLLNKASLASPEICSEWEKYYSSQGVYCIRTDCNTGSGLQSIIPTVRKILSEKLERYDLKGMANRSLKALVVGVPNCGKSTFINRMAGSSKAKAENRPGVTRTQQWICTDIGLDLLDTPGVLWPKFEDRTVGENLAATGAIKDSILDRERIACIICNRLKAISRSSLAARYKLTEENIDSCENDWELLLLIGKKRGFLISGGEIDTERTANMLIEEFRSAKIGRLTLERPPDTAKNKNRAEAQNVGTAQG